MSVEITCAFPDAGMSEPRSLPSYLPSHPYSSRSTQRFLSPSEPVASISLNSSAGSGSFSVSKQTNAEDDSDSALPQQPEQHSGSPTRSHEADVERQTPTCAGPAELHEPTSGASPKPKPRSLCSSAKLENARYQPAGPSRPDHPNEDEMYMSPQGSVKLFAVFDGHDGSNAVRFATRYLENMGKTFLMKVEQKDDITEGDLVTLFLKIDAAFFDSIKYYIARKQTLQAAIPAVSVVTCQGFFVLLAESM